MLNELLDRSQSDGYTVSMEDDLIIRSQTSKPRICCSLYSVLTSRIVLNIRQATWEEKGITTQLHAYEENTTTSADLPLDFHGVNASTGTDLQVV